MDWFDDLFGELENPQFRYDYVTVSMDMPSPSWRKSKLATQLDVKDGWCGWIGLDHGHFRRYVHGKISAPKFDILKHVPYKNGYPTDITITGKYGSYSMDVYFVDSMRPYHSRIAVNKNHKVDSIAHYVHNKNHNSCIFFTKGPSRAIDTFSTTFIDDEILRMEWNTLVDRCDLDGIKNFLIEHGNKDVRYGTFT